MHGSRRASQVALAIGLAAPQQPSGAASGSAVTGHEKPGEESELWLSRRAPMAAFDEMNRDGKSVNTLLAARPTKRKVAWGAPGVAPLALHSYFFILVRRLPCQRLGGRASDGREPSGLAHARPTCVSHAAWPVRVSRA